MKTTFTKSQNLILITLGFIGITFLTIPIINHSHSYLMSTIALIYWLSLGLYINYLKHKRFVSKGSKIFLLYNLKKKNTINIVMILFLIGLFIIFSDAYEFSFFGLLIMIGVLLYISLSSILFPYGNGFLIMIDNTTIYSYETGFIKWNQIKRYTLKTDSMFLDIELKNNETKSIVYNKFLDAELFKKELDIQFKKYKELATIE